MRFAAASGNDEHLTIFMRNFRELLDTDGVYVFDGAMGTRLYDKGVYINRSYDELNLVAADLVREVHDEYVRAGAEIIETNSFGATRHKLQSYGLEAKIREINIAAARIAKEAAGENVFVAGAIGPLGLRIEPFGPTSYDEAKEMFKEQARGAGARRRAGPGADRDDAPGGPAEVRRGGVGLLRDGAALG